MRKLTKFTLMFFAAAIAGGCASTSNQNDTPQYPVLKVLSDKPYVWEDSISEALNIARMAQPAGVGVGMMDYPDGTKATTGRVSSGMQLFDAALGLGASGLFGVLQMGSLNEGVNSDLDWKPSIVSLVDKGEISIGLVNHYYIWEVSEGLGREIKVKNGFFRAGDIGNLINVSGAGVLASSKKYSAAEDLINFLTSQKVQEDFVSKTHEYSLLAGATSPAGLPKLLDIGAPTIDLEALKNISVTQDLLVKVGLL